MDKQRADNYELHRREVAKTLLKDRTDDFLVVTGLGSPNWDATNAGDHPLTFPLWGAMGGAATMGLGLATAQPTKRVMVMTGDGEMLMAMGSFATIAAQGVENLAIVVFDNERYGETGMQATHTAGPVDMAAVAKACG
ncbi:MAG TPA: aldehyde dehydrogenase, partial [Rhodospirillaceae bacterium]|nr:aldehyde dehydrogenase [Rhodospirillaceae bacterium]